MFGLVRKGSREKSNTRAFRVNRTGVRLEQALLTQPADAVLSAKFRSRTPVRLTPALLILGGHYRYLSAAAHDGFDRGFTI